MMRSARQKKILDLIANQAVETQDDLARLLKDAGFNATQATISRDIKELAIVKISVDGKRQKYIREQSDRTASGKILSLFKHALVSVRFANNIVVIRTIPGSANIAGMMLDRLDCADILGCVAGDDTVMAVTTSEQSARAICELLSDDESIARKISSAPVYDL